MICSYCKEAGVLNSANGNFFYYCRGCKVEIMLEEAPKDDSPVPVTQVEVAGTVVGVGPGESDPFGVWQIVKGIP